MPLIRSASRRAVSQNIREMVAAGHPQRQAVAAALHTADEARRKHGDGKMKGLSGGPINQHKREAMGERLSGNDVMSGLPTGMAHPDREMDTGAVMGDHERPIGGHVGGGRGKMPAQAHPDHGPHHHHGRGAY